MCVKLNGNLCWNGPNPRSRCEECQRLLLVHQMNLHFNHGIIILRSHWYRFNSFLLMTLTIILRISSSIPKLNTMLLLFFYLTRVFANVELYAIDLWFESYMDQNGAHTQNGRERKTEIKRQRHFLPSRCLLYIYFFFLLKNNADGLGFLFKFKWDKMYIEYAIEFNDQVMSLTSGINLCMLVFLLRCFSLFIISFWGSWIVETRQMLQVCRRSTGRQIQIVEKQWQQIITTTRKVTSFSRLGLFEAVLRAVKNFGLTTNATQKIAKRKSNQKQKKKNTVHKHEWNIATTSSSIWSSSSIKCSSYSTIV